MEPRGRTQQRRPRRGEIRRLLGVDTGGTFTDLVLLEGRSVTIHKVRSTSEDPSRAVLEGLQELLGDGRADLLTYGSTVATNALLERRGARVGLVTNAGFEDVVEIGRQNRLDLYALDPSRPSPLVLRRLRKGVRERTLFDGTQATKLTETEVQRTVRFLKRARPEAVAICLLHAYANPEAEEQLATAMEELQVPISVSSRLLAEYREYERFSTTVVNAYVAPAMVRHLRALERAVPVRRMRIMASDGTAADVSQAIREPVRTILSGPAAGVVGAAAQAGGFGTERFLTFDMGGTSTDVSLVDGRAELRQVSHPLGYPVCTPVIDIHTVGAGGGSIARLDPGGSLKVGPESAGADPGPACYGTGTRPTVTDANLVAGRLVAESFLGGRMILDARRAERALRGLARDLGTSVADAAAGILRVVNAGMERAIRVITVERGRDPRDFALVAFGGAGPMHAADLARELGIRHVILPRDPGLLCAYGALAAPFGREVSRTVRLRDPGIRELERRTRSLERPVRSHLRRRGASDRAIRIERSVDVRYRGEAFEIEVPLRHDFAALFHQRHRQLFGHGSETEPLEVVNLRVRGHVRETSLPVPQLGRTSGRPTPRHRSRVLLDRRERTVPVFHREGLRPGHRLRGPLLVTELSATAWVPPETSLRVDEAGNLHLEAQ